MQLTIDINFRSSNNADEERAMVRRVKTKKKIMVNDKADEVKTELFQSLHSIY